MPDVARVRAGSAVWLFVVVASLSGCSRHDEAAHAPVDHAATPHSDHSPRFGGLVLMERDIHFEVTARPSGEYRVYFSDDRRNPLPASTVANAVITVMRPAGDAEIVTLQPDASDRSWLGTSRPVDSGDTTVRVSYFYRDQPYWIDLPFNGFPTAGASTGPPGSR